MKEALSNVGQVAEAECVGVVDSDKDLLTADGLPDELRGRLKAATVDIAASSVLAEYEKHRDQGCAEEEAIGRCVAGIERVEQIATEELERERAP